MSPQQQPALKSENDSRMSARVSLDDDVFSDKSFSGDEIAAGVLLANDLAQHNAHYN